MIKKIFNNGLTFWLITESPQKLQKSPRPQTHRIDYILWYKIQKIKKCETFLGYALLYLSDWTTFYILGQKFIKFLHCFFGKLETQKSNSEINWPLPLQIFRTSYGFAGNFCKLHEYVSQTDCFMSKASKNMKNYSFSF